MKKTHVWTAVMIGALAPFRYAAAEPAVSAVVQSAFLPYSTEIVRHEGISAGMTIGQQNWQVTEKVLPAEIVRLVQAGDLSIVVQETTDLPARQAYISATEQHA